MIKKLKPNLSLINLIKPLTDKVLHARIRVLPIVIFTCCMLLTVKLNLLREHFEVSSSVIGISTVVAEEEKLAASEVKPETRDEEDKGKPGKPSQKEGSTEISAKNDPQQEKDKNSMISAKAEGSKKDNEPPSTKISDLDPSKLSSEKYSLLKQASESDQVAKTDETAKVKETALEAVESRIKKRLAEMGEDKKTLENYLKKTDEKRDEQLVRLVKMAENMDAKQAAKILEGVEFPILLDLMEKIKEAKGSAILSKMDPEKASFLMSELAKRGKTLNKDKA
ncbi:MotE family protein [Candidatus Nucleicultrix amoebiphila]|jgi:flagellar motility protein MotE (MotC chaperone)|uniref:Magnesium transporter MgtE intracellular domain-containing protein n=1 Tax=Candidatus Nucleicultrix amoebiphila FS5 TaxID=1414854 RepID=A0A1W6N3T2_9PROT|nr:hypothetical protein [Candidatus Nucleicultrix amoebiphila]ARN84515.1 hypothetical protein GQ61_03350 [Candidatus Nucleicultrix amoebiphila FS5]